jgi:hypothetical protein
MFRPCQARLPDRVCTLLLRFVTSTAERWKYLWPKFSAWRERVARQGRVSFSSARSAARILCFLIPVLQHQGRTTPHRAGGKQALERRKTLSLGNDGKCDEKTGQGARRVRRRFCLHWARLSRQRRKPLPGRSPLRKRPVPQTRRNAPRIPKLHPLVRGGTERQTPAPC